MKNTYLKWHHKHVSSKNNLSSQKITFHVISFCNYMRECRGENGQINKKHTLSMTCRSNCQGPFSVSVIASLHVCPFICLSVSSILSVLIQVEMCLHVRISKNWPCACIYGHAKNVQQPKKWIEKHPRNCVKIHYNNYCHYPKATAWCVRVVRNGGPFAERSKKWKRWNKR